MKYRSLSKNIYLEERLDGGVDVCCRATGVRIKLTREEVAEAPKMMKEMLDDTV